MNIDDLTPNSGLPAAKKYETVGIIFGRFNPSHVGHRAAWSMASKNDHWYVGTNKNTHDAKNPLPFDTKIQAMEAVWPQVANHIIEHKSWLTLAGEIYARHGDVTLNVYTDEDWVIQALNKYNDINKAEAHGYYNFSQIVPHKTPRISSATLLRDAVKNGDREAFYAAAGVDSDTMIDGKEYYDVVEQHLSGFGTRKKTTEDKYTVTTKDLTMSKKINEQQLNEMKFLAGIIKEAAPVVFDTETDSEYGNEPEYDTSPIKRHEKGDKTGDRTYEPTSPRDAESAASRPDAAGSSDPAQAEFTDSASDSGYSIANRMGGADPSDMEARKEVFLRELVKSPTALLGEINARLGNDDNSLAVSDRLSGIISDLGEEGGVTDLDSEDRSFVLKLVANAIKKMDLEKGEPGVDEGLDFSDIKNDYGISEDDDPCWDGYEAYGTKKKNGKEVPNCIPEGEEIELDADTDSFEIGSVDPRNGEKIDVTVVYRSVGDWRPETYGQPEEYPDYEIISVTDLDSGAELVDLLGERELRRLESEAEEIDREQGEAEYYGKGDWEYEQSLYDSKEIEEASSRRLIKKIEKGNRAVKIYKDTEWDEFIIQFFEDGEYNRAADYHTDDKEDAIGTAKNFFLNKESKEVCRHCGKKNCNCDDDALFDDVDEAVDETADKAFEAAMAEMRKLAGLKEEEPSKKAPRPDFTMEIDDPMDDEGMLEIGVNYTVSGKYYPQTREEPEEHPDLEIQSIIDMETGRELFTPDDLSEEQMEDITDAAWKDHEEDDYNY